MGVRSQRYSMVVEDGVVKSLNVEDTPSKADIDMTKLIVEAVNLLRGGRASADIPRTGASAPAQPQEVASR